MKTEKIRLPQSGFITRLLLPAVIILLIFFQVTVRAQWNTNTSVNITIANVVMADMQAAPTSDGKTWIAFYHENGGNYDMRAQLIDKDGFKLLGQDGILVDNQTSGSATYVFNVCVDGDNNFIIGYQDERTGTLQAVVYKISQNGTKLWGDHGVVLGGGLAPYPAALSNNEVAVVWNGDAGNTLNLQKITAAGALAWTSPIQIKVGSSTTTRGQIIANTAGKFTMVYQKGNMSTTLYAQMFSNSGTALYQPLQICTQATAAYRYYSIDAEDDTTYYGYYASVGLRFNSFLQRINPNGTIPWGINGSNFNTSVSTNDNYQGETSIRMKHGSDYVWSVCNFMNPNQTQYGVYIQKFLKTTGARQFTDLGKVVYPISGSADQRCGNLEVVNDNPMFMSYNSTEKIFATRLDASGNFAWPGNRVEVSSTTASAGTPKMRYCFTPDGPDRFACTWTENRGGEGYKGYAQGISVGGLIGLEVSTQGGVPAVISANGGTLQMVATVFPSTASQSVVWSIVPGTGMATITATGLVTGISNGTAYAKAKAVQDTTVTDSLLITMTGQVGQPPSVITLAATSVTSGGATLNGTVNANTLATNVIFEWGLTTAYGQTATATPPTVTGNTVTAVEAAITGLTSNTTYHFRVKGSNLAGTTNGQDLTFTTPTGVGVAESPKEVAMVFPNPSNGHFGIMLRNQPEKTFTLEIFDALGSTIFYKQNIILSVSYSFPVHLGTVPPGIYLIRLTNGNETFVKRITVVSDGRF